MKKIRPASSHYLGPNGDKPLIDLDNITRDGFNQKYSGILIFMTDEELEEYCLTDSINPKLKEDIIDYTNSVIVDLFNEEKIVCFNYTLNDFYDLNVKDFNQRKLQSNFSKNQVISHKSLIINMFSQYKKNLSNNSSEEDKAKVIFINTAFSNVARELNMINKKLVAQNKDSNDIDTEDNKGGSNY